VAKANIWEMVSAGSISVLIEALRRISDPGLFGSGSIIATARRRLRPREMILATQKSRHRLPTNLCECRSSIRCKSDTLGSWPIDDKTTNGPLRSHGGRISVKVEDCSER
jgi:hypothetical protein